MLITNFASGELSQWLFGRTEIPQYYQAAQTLKNFEIIPTGGIRRRTGTKRLGKLNGACRLIPFILDKDNSFILEFTENKIYFWKNGQKMIDNDVQLSVNTEYTLAEVNDIQYAQDFNRMIFVQKNHKPMELVYTNNTFTAGEMTFSFYPDVELDDDYNFVKIIPNDEGLPEAAADGDYCIWKGKLYIYSETEQKWKVDTKTTDPEIDTDLFGIETKYPGCVSFFNNRLFFASTIAARQRVWASCTPDTQNTRYNNFATYKKYVTVNKVVKDADVHLFTGNILMVNIDQENKTTKITGLSQDLTETLDKDYTEYYLTKADVIPVGAKVIDLTANSITVDKVATITEDANALVFTISLWKSTELASADDYTLEVMSTNITTSDCSFNFELASDQNDAIRFIGASKYLTIGTESSIWAAPAGINALQVQVDMNGRYGSDEIQGHCVDTAMIYFAQGKCGIREYYYNPQAEAFQTNNIAILSEQMLTESPAVDFDFVTNPYNRLIITREDGTVVTMLYDKTNGVMAWNRIEHGENKIKSCCTTRGELQNDLIYFAVKDGEDYYLELLDSNIQVFLDSWKKYEDKEDGEYNENAVVYVPSTDIVYPYAEYTGEEEAYIGYLYESMIKSMPVMADTPDRKKRITNLIFRFLDSAMPTLRTENLPDEDFIDVEEPFTGIKSIDYPGITEREVTFTMTISKPKKCNILSVNANLSV